MASHSRQRQSSRGFAAVDQLGSLTAVIAGGAIGWLIGELLATRFTQWADLFQAWSSYRLTHPSGHFDLSEIIIGLPLAFVALVFNIFSLVFAMAHRLYLTVALGALAGLLPSPFSRACKAFTHGLGFGAAVAGVSAKEVVTTKGVRNRLWALVPVLLVVVAVAFLAKAADWFRPHARVVERFMRYRPTDGWTTQISDNTGGIELRSVELEPNRLGAVIRLSNHTSGPGHTNIAGSSTLRRDYDRTFAGAFTTPTGTDGQIPLDRDLIVPPHGYIEGTIYFSRPREPFVPWRLTLFVSGKRAEFFFQLPEDGSGG